jgi:hypothetical protein
MDKQPTDSSKAKKHIRLVLKKQDIRMLTRQELARAVAGEGIDETSRDAAGSCLDRGD